MECQQHNCTKPAKFGFSGHPTMCSIHRYLFKGMAPISDMDDEFQMETSCDHFSPEKKQRAKKQLKDWVLFKNLTVENFDSVQVAAKNLRDVARRLSDTHLEFSVDRTKYFQKQELCHKGSGFHVLE